MAKHGYPIDDMCAMAEARGCSYGDIQQHLEFGAPLPPLRKSVKWPQDSVHQGEQQLPGERARRAVPIVQEPEPVPAAKSKAGRKPAEMICGSCGAPSDPLLRITLHVGPVRHQSRRLIGKFCPECAAPLLPESPLSRREKFPTKDEAGNPVNAHDSAKCFRCGHVFARIDGGRITAGHYSDDFPTAGYLCPGCLPAWKEKAETPKTGIPAAATMEAQFHV